MKKLIHFLFGKPGDPQTLAKTATLKNCANCGSHLNGPYCSKCGQKKEGSHDFTLSHFLGETFHAFTHFDTKFFVTFKYLFRAPGLLTLEFIKGHRKKYMNPIQLFLISNVIYFLFPLFNTFTTPLQYQMNGGAIIKRMVNEKIQKTGISYSEFETRFNESEKGEAKTLVIIMVPLFALFFSLMFLKQKRYFVEQLVFSFHFFSFLLFFEVVGIFSIYIVLNILALVISKLGMKAFAITMLQFYNTDMGISTIILTLFFFYFFIAIKRVYSQSNMESFFKSLGSIIFLAATVMIYRYILFFSTFYGIKLSLH